MGKTADYSYLLHQKFGRLEVIALEKRARPNNGPAWYCNCSCECGNEKVVFVYDLLAGKTVSCGCFFREELGKRNTTHGFSEKREYFTYKQMLSRCYDKNAAGYEHYGGRGIKVCERWLEAGDKGLTNFIQDMGERPEGTTLDRISVNGDYTPTNCRWASPEIQSFNKRKSKRNKSGRTGVRMRKDHWKWKAEIVVNRRTIHLGYFELFEDAVEARKTAELNYYGFVLEEQV